jgi:hypothetical protein
MQRSDSVHLECETITAQVAKTRLKSLNVPMSLTEDAEAKGQKGKRRMPIQQTRQMKQCTPIKSRVTYRQFEFP